MDDAPGVQVVESPQQLPNDLEDLLLLEDAEFLLEGEEGILCVFEYDVEVRRCGVVVVEFYYVLVVGKCEYLDLPDEVLHDLLGVLKGDRFLGEERVGLLLLHQVDEGVRAHSDALDAVEEELLGGVDMRGWLFGGRLGLLCG